MMWEVFKAFFEALISGFELGKELAPTDKMQEGKFDREKKRLEAAEYTKQLKKLRAWLIAHPRQSVDAVIDLKCDGYDEDDIADFRTALYELFPKRKHVKSK